MYPRRLTVALMTSAALAACARSSPPSAAPPTPYVPTPPAAAVPVRPVAPLGPSNASVAIEAPSVEGTAVFRRGACFVRTAWVHPCHGAPLTEPPTPMRVELCDGCRDDVDCRAGRAGRCVLVAGNTCAPSLRACRYPGDACSRCEGRPTFAVEGCLNDGAGHAVCVRLGPPPPAAPSP